MNDTGKLRKRNPEFSYQESNWNLPITSSDQEKMRDREGDAQSSPWDILISVKLFLDGTKTEVCFPRGPQSQQARVVAILNIHQQPLHNAISTSSDEFIWRHAQYWRTSRETDFRLMGSKNNFCEIHISRPTTLLSLSVPHFLLFGCSTTELQETRGS